MDVDTHPRELEEFCYLDQWAAEAYLTALDAGEERLLKLLNEGKKIHNWMLDVTKEKFPAEVAASGYNYKRAKQTVHGLNYGMEAEKSAKESGLPLYVAQWQSLFYHGSFPGIKLRQKRIQDELIRTRTLTSVLGRKRVFLAPFGPELLNQAYAWPSQSCIGELTNIGLTKLMHIGLILKDPWMFPCLNTHDGLVIRMLKGTREQVKARVRQAFNLPLVKNGLRATIPIEVGFGPNFQEHDEDVEVIRYE